VHLLQAIPELRARTHRAVWTTPQLACAPLTVLVPRIVDHRLLLVGDAAGTVDAITGDGIASALASVAAAAEAIVSGRLHDYERRRLEAGRTGRRLAGLLLRLSRVEGLAARLLLQRPRLVPTLLDVAIGRRPMTAVTAIRALGPPGRSACDVRSEEPRC
jgi:flavin-dependent dehydrogenase